MADYRVVTMSYIFGLFVETRQWKKNHGEWEKKRASQGKHKVRHLDKTKRQNQNTHKPRAHTLFKL